VDRADKTYFETVIEPLIDHPLIEYVGEIGEAEKCSFLGNAYALLFPIDWPEPFGLVMIEAMACGAPVIARLHGAVPEVLEQGVTGYIVKNVDDAVQAVRNIPKISRNRCREVFETRFTARRMAENYVNVYKKVIEARQCQPIVVNFTAVLDDRLLRP
jgi:glycosyltransferase involved in cell wall biosynthesis